MPEPEEREPQDEYVVSGPEPVEQAPGGQRLKDDIVRAELSEHGEHSEGRPVKMISDLDENVPTLQELRDRLDKVDPPPPEQGKARIEAEKAAVAERRDK